MLAIRLDFHQCTIDIQAITLLCCSLIISMQLGASSCNVPVYISLSARFTKVFRLNVYMYVGHMPCQDFLETNSLVHRALGLPV